MIVSKELLRKVGSAAEWGEGRVMDDTGKPKVLPAFLASVFRGKDAPILVRIPAQPRKRETAISGRGTG